MQTIALEQLDPMSRQWLRQARRDEPIIVTERGTPILTLTITPQPKAEPVGSMARRVLRPGYAELMNEPVGGTGITEILEQDREDRW